MNTTEIIEKVFKAKGREEKRSILKSLSKNAKILFEMNKVEETKINDIILNHFYKTEKHQEFNTFKGWQEKGYKVKKGAKAFFIWSKPIKAKKTKKEDSEKDQKDEFKMFGIANIFSNEQVEKVKKV